LRVVQGRTEYIRNKKTQNEWQALIYCKYL